MSLESWQISIITAIISGLLYGIISLYVMKSQVDTQFKLQKNEIQHELKKIREEKILSKKIEKAESIIIALRELYYFYERKAPLILRFSKFLSKRNGKENEPIPSEDGDQFWFTVNRLLDGLDYHEFMKQWKSEPGTTLYNFMGQMDLIIDHSLDDYDEKCRDIVGALVYFSNDEANEIGKYYRKIDELYKNGNIFHFDEREYSITLKELNRIISDLEDYMRSILLSKNIC